MMKRCGVSMVDSSREIWTLCLKVSCAGGSGLAQSLRSSRRGCSSGGWSLSSAVDCDQEASIARRLDRHNPTTNVTFASQSVSPTFVPSRPSSFLAPAPELVRCISQTLRPFHPNGWVRSSSSPSPIWELHPPSGSFRMLASKVSPEDGSSSGVEAKEESSQGGTQREEQDATTAQRSIDDFQHEEIVGPTVERDVSATANELRESLTALRSFMVAVGRGLLVLGSVQMLGAIWNSYAHADPLNIGLWRELPAPAMAYILAYFLWQTGSAMDFFSRLEGRSRIQVLTLSLQLVKGLSQFFQRTDVVVKCVVFATFILLAGDMYHYK